MKGCRSLRMAALLSASALTAAVGLATPQPEPGTLVTHETKVTTITGTYIPQKIRRIGSITDSGLNVTVIDRAQIEHSGAATLAQVLSKVPGISVGGR